MIQHELVGKEYRFEDGNSIKIIEVKHRDDGLWVSAHIGSLMGIPRPTIMPLKEFTEMYGHLFGLSSPPEYPSR